LTELLDRLVMQPYSEAILHPGQTPGSAAGRRFAGRTTGAWLGRRAKLREAAEKR